MIIIVPIFVKYSENVDIYLKKINRNIWKGQWLNLTLYAIVLYFTIILQNVSNFCFVAFEVNSSVLLCVGPPPVHQLIRNDKTEKPPTVTVSNASTFSSVLRQEDGHRGIESPHSQTGMYLPVFVGFRTYKLSLSLFRQRCESLKFSCLWRFVWEERDGRDVREYSNIAKIE